jgi:hypothetical protein
LKIKSLRIFAFIIFGFLLHQCNPKEDPHVQNIEVQAAFYPFDQALFTLDTLQPLQAQLNTLSKDYAPFFIGTEEVFWSQQIRSPMLHELKKKIDQVHKDFTPIEKELKKLIQYHRYYTQDTSFYKVYTYISNLDFEYPIILSDGLVFIALDLYLGADFIGYQSQPQYIANTYVPQNLSLDVALAWANQSMAMPKESAFIDVMIQEGKKLALAHRLLPQKKNHEMMKYTEQDFEFCKNNEREMWLYFLDQKYLFSTDYNLQRRFLLPAPFSKFDTGFDSNIPGRVGAWLGWQIVESYWKQNPKLTYLELAQETDHRKIFNQSKYRP